MTNANTISIGARPRGMTRWETFAHCIAGTGVVINAISGLWVKYWYGEVEGWPLLIHMAGAGVFMAGMAAVVLMWADRCRFGVETGLNPLQKTVFWVVAALALTSMLSMLTSMLPVLGTEQQEIAFEVHEIGGWMLLVAVIVHTVVSLAARRAKR